jgi:hypothetical protein
MKHFRQYFVVKLLLVALAFSMAGCSSVMRKTTLVDHLDSDTALVNFVRPAIFFGDGRDYDLWDGNKYIGEMEAGKIVQYRAKPGPHVFMANGFNWSYVKADLVGGKQYFLKGSVVPFHGIILGVVDVKTDARVKEWLTYSPRELVAEKGVSYSARNKDRVESALKELNEGRANSFELKPDNGLSVGN